MRLDTNLQTCTSTFKTDREYQAAVDIFARQQKERFSVTHDPFCLYSFTRAD